MGYRDGEAALDTLDQLLSIGSIVIGTCLAIIFAWLYVKNYVAFAIVTSAYYLVYGIFILYISNRIDNRHYGSLSTFVTGTMRWSTYILLMSAFFTILGTVYRKSEDATRSSADKKDKKSKDGQDRSLAEYKAKMEILQSQKKGNNKGPGKPRDKPQKD